jgi:hypothetical protein
LSLQLGFKRMCKKHPLFILILLKPAIMKNVLFKIAIVLPILLTSCSSTTIVNSWKDPNTKIHSNQWNKILVVAMLKNETESRKAEDEMVTYLKGKGTTSYTYLERNKANFDDEELRKKMRIDGYNAAITMRLIDVDKEKVYVPGQSYLYPSYYKSFGRYYHRNWAFYTSPGYYVVTKKFLIETILYSINEDKIIWSGITETYNPNGVSKLTSEIACTIHKKMIAEGFIDKE